MYAWLVVVVVATPVWVVVTCSRSIANRWRAVEVASRWVRHLLPSMLDLRGALPGERPLLVAPNHTSMVDGLAIALLLPGPLQFVVTDRFATTPVLGSFLRRLGVVFVGDHETTASSTAHPDIDRLTSVLTDDAVMVVFPEGGLGSGAALRPFHHGALLAACRAGAAVVPVRLTGTRAVLPPHHRLPRPGHVTAAVGPTLRPSGTGWPDALALGIDVRRSLESAGDATAGRP